GDVVGVREHVHEVGDRRALVSGHIGAAGLKQRLGHRQDRLAAEFLPRREPQLLYLVLEGSLCHCKPLDYPGTSASTRSGLPEPFLIFRGAAISTAPVGGSWSRLARLASPNLFAPCIRWCAGIAGSNAKA